MKRLISIVFIALVALVILNSQPASAEIITVEVTGVVDVVRGGLALDGSVGVGSIMTGYCTYATDTLDEYPANEYIGVYPLISILMTVGNYAFTHDPTSTDSPYFKVGTVDPTYNAMTQSGRFDGTVTINGSGPLTYDDITWNWTYISVFHLWTSSSEQIPTDALPDLASWPELSVFDVNRGFDTRFSDESSSNRYFEIYGEITSLTVVPEPATLFLLGLGSLALLTNRRFR